MPKYPVIGASAGEVDIPDSGGGGGSGGAVDAGAGRASVSYPWLDNFVGYGTLYEDRDGNYFRNINAGFNGVLTINPASWPPGYRISSSSKGGSYPPSGSKPTGNEPIRLCPPPKGVGRLTYHTRAKLVITNPGTQKGSFTTGLGVVYVNGPSRPMYPYLGAAHDLEVRDMRPETIAGGETRSVVMFRADFIDIGMNGGSATFPNWPNWEMLVSTQTNAEARNMYPAVGISFVNSGGVALQVGNIFAYGWVS